MIKFKTTGKNGAVLLGFGLEEGNIERLKAGQPIYFQLDELGIEGHDVMIMYGKDQADITKQLEDAGLEMPNGQ